MIYIENGMKVMLPGKFRFSHNISVIIHDLILEIGTNPVFNDLKSTKLNLKPGESDSINEAKEKGIDILDWLKANGKKEVAEQFICKEVFQFVLADAISFLYESLHSAMTGKMVVAYSLLRKPFTDNLLVLEQLHTERASFIDNFFHQGDPKGYDPSHKNLGEDRIRSIIAKSVERIKVFGGFEGGLIYDLRYNKSSVGGLNGRVHQALHLVTTDSNYITNRKSLNFMYSPKEQNQELWEHYYKMVPYLIIYLSAVCDQIAFSLVDHNDNLRVDRELRRLIALTFWSTQAHPHRTKEAYKVFRTIGREVRMKCKKCQTSNSFTKVDFKLYLETTGLLCRKCVNVLHPSLESIQKVRAFFNGQTKS